MTCAHSLSAIVSSCADGSRVVFYNRCVPLPLGLVDISIRLAGGFYRQPDALRHDVQLLAANARLFNDDQAAIIGVADGVQQHHLLPFLQRQHLRVST